MNVKREAKAAGISVAECVRRAIRRVLRGRTGKPWMRYAGFVESGDSRSSQKSDDIVYRSKDWVLGRLRLRPFWTVPIVITPVSFQFPGDGVETLDS